MANKLQVIFEVIGKGLDQFSKAQGKINAFGASAKKSFDQLASIRNIAGVAAGYVFLRREINASVEAYKLQQDAETKLDSALRSTGNTLGYTKEQLKGFADEMQNTTRYGNEAVMGAEALMVTFTQVGKQVFPDALKAAADMSAMFGQDLQQSVIQLGTALNDPIAGVGRLRRIGISFSAEQKKSIEQFVKQNDLMSAQRVILDELKLEIGGVAEALGSTDLGQLERSKNILGDLREEVGKKLIPVLLEVNNITIFWYKNLVKVLDNYKRISDWQKSSIADDVNKAAVLRVIEEKNNLLKFKALAQEQGDKEKVAEIDARILRLNAKIIELQGRRTAEQKTPTLKPLKPTAPVDEDAAKKYQDKLKRVFAELERESAQQKERTNQTFKTLDEQYRQEKLTADRRFAEAQIEAQRDPTLNGLAAFENRAAIELRMLREQHAQELAEITLNGEAKRKLIAAQQIEETAIVRAQAAERKSYMTDEMDRKVGILDFGLQAVQTAAQAESEIEKNRRRQMKPILRSLAIMRMAAATAVGIGKAWETGKTWYEGLALSIATGVENTALLALQLKNINSAATGADFVATRPQLLMVGDNPNRKERVQVTPIGSPNLYGPGGSRNRATTDNSIGTVNFTINDQATGARLQRALRSGELRNFVMDLKGALA